MTTTEEITGLIFMIETEHETEGGNGSYYDWYIDPDYGFYTTREAAYARLEACKEKEQIAHRRNWERTTYKPWKRRVEDHRQTVEQNIALVAAGLPTLPTRRVGDEPEYKPLTHSEYRLVEIEPGS